MTDYTSERKDSIATTPRTRRAEYALLGAVCALVLAVYAWSAKPGLWEQAGWPAGDLYYNSLVQGLCAGQLDLNKAVPVGLARLADPCDPVANSPYRVLSGLHDLSYYHGKLYSYFGVTPALLLFWPWHEFTGRYLRHQDAVLIFCAAGFLAGAGLLVALWRRYFAPVGLGVVSACLLALGLASGVPLLLARSSVCEVPISCGYALSIVALALLWRAVPATPRRCGWLAAASLACGLAVGARPSLLFGAAILLVPVVQAAREPAVPDRPRRLGALLLAAAGPMVLIGLGLLLYNFLRFDHPFEFGQRYQLSGFQQSAMQQFSLRYLWTNFRVGWLEPVRWTAQFPFVQNIAVAPLPQGYFEIGQAFGVLTNLPVVWLALAAPLAWRGRLPEARSALRLLAVAFLLLCGTSALILSLHNSMNLRYELEFLSPLLWLAVLGILGSERALADRPAPRPAARCGWGLLLGISVAFSLLARYSLYSQTCADLGSFVLQKGHLDEAIAQFQKALALQPANVPARLDLGDALLQKGRANDALVQYQTALDLDPHNLETRNKLGILLLQQGNAAAAIPHLSQVLAAYPGVSQACFNLGSALRQSGRLDEAIACFRRALALQPLDPDARASLAAALLQQGRAPEAAAQYQRALELAPPSPALFNRLAWLLATCADPSVRNGRRAVELAEKANELAGGKNPETLDTLAAAYAEAGRFDDAIRAAQQAIELATAAAQSEPARRIQARLQSYQAGQPFHEEPAPRP